MRFSVIVPTHNRAAKLEKTIESLVRQDFDPTRFEIIVADNCSTDNSRTVVEVWQRRSPVKISYFYEARAGVHYARNAAIRHSAGEILYYTDDDMEADPKVLQAFDTVMHSYPEVGVVMGKVLPKWEVTPPHWILQLCYNGNLSLQTRDEELVISKRDVGVYSCHEAIRREILEECGGFRPENTAGVWVGNGETGLHLEMEKKGYKFAYTNRAITYHVIPPERLTQKYFNKRMRNQGYADSFTQFNRGLVGVETLRRSITKHRLRAFEQLIRAALFWLIGKIRWRKSRAEVSYWLARSDFDQRLVHNAQWRKQVTRQSWFDEMEAQEIQGRTLKGATHDAKA